MTPTGLHGAVARLEFLVGTWRGEGRGSYPTIEDFAYREEVSFGHVGKPFLIYQQRTRSPDGAPMHAEAGFLRPVGEDRAEFLLAQPTGVTEIHTGTVVGTHVDFVSGVVGLSPTAKDVRSVRRIIEVDGDHLSYRLDMAAVGQDEQFHLEATLRRVESVS